MKTIFFLLMAAILGGCLSGCATSRLDNLYTRADGTTSETKYFTLSTAWPFGKLDSSVANMKTQFGGGTMTVGQDAKGFDNTAQAAVIAAVIKAAIAAAASTVVPVVPVVPGGP